MGEAVGAGMALVGLAERNRMSNSNEERDEGDGEGGAHQSSDWVESHQPERLLQSSVVLFVFEATLGSH